MFVRRRPLLRAAVVGGGAYMAGKRRGERSAETTEPGPGPGQAAQSGGQETPQSQAGGPAAVPTAGASMSDQLAKLSSLHQQGSLTDDEFAAAKSRLLAG